MFMHRAPYLILHLLVSALLYQNRTICKSFVLKHAKCIELNLNQLKMDLRL